MTNKILEHKENLITEVVGYLKPLVNDLDLHSVEYKRNLKNELTEMAEAVQANDPSETTLKQILDAKMDGADATAKVFYRKDLKEAFKNVPFEHVIYETLMTSSIKTGQSVSFIIFIDVNGDTKLIKNRHGKDGIVK